MPRKRITGQKSHLPAEQVRICLRVKEARERIGLDQAEATRRLGVKVHVLANIEKCRAPLRCDLALRFCRELFLNEEWLARGSLSLMEAALRSVGVINLDVRAWEPIFFRTPLDLLSQTVARAVPHRMLFNDAFEQYFQSVAVERSNRSWLWPRIAFSPHDRQNLRAEFLALLIDRWAQLIRFRAIEVGLAKETWPLVEADLVDNITLAGMLIFCRSQGISTPFQSNQHFDFLRILARDETTPIGFLSSVESVTVKGEEISFDGPVIGGGKGEKNKSPLDVVIGNDDNSQMPPLSGPLLPVLIERLKRALGARGAKAQLARELGVPRQSLNAWLSGARTPDGETTLTLQHWVTAAEAEQNKAPEALRAQPGQKTRSTKSKEHEKAKPDQPK